MKSVLAEIDWGAVLVIIIGIGLLAVTIIFGTLTWILCHHLVRWLT